MECSEHEEHGKNQETPMEKGDVLETSQSYQAVKAFMKGAGQSVHDTFHHLTEAERVLRARLILEEAMETIVLGLGVEIMLLPHTDAGYGTTVQRPAYGDKFMDQFRLEARWDMDNDEFVDGVMDMNVVGLGSLVVAGLPDVAFRREVDDNNLLKIANGHLDEHGKFIKPKGHPAPDIHGLMDKIVALQGQNDA